MKGDVCGAEAPLFHNAHFRGYLISLIVLRIEFDTKRLQRPIFRWRFDAPYVARSIELQSQQPKPRLLSKRNAVHYLRSDVSRYR